MELKIVEHSDELTHVAMVGSFDIRAVREIEPEFLRQTSARQRPTVVDMTEADFVSSACMGMLMGCAQRLKPSGATMVVLNPQPLVEKAMRAAGFHMAVPITATMEEARSVLDGQADS